MTLHDIVHTKYDKNFLRLSYIVHTVLYFVRTMYDKTVVRCMDNVCTLYILCMDNVITLNLNLYGQCMDKVISFRVTDAEFDLFRQLAAADNRSVSAYFKNLARQDSYKTGTRTHSTVARQHPGSTTSTVVLPTKTPAMPSANTVLGSLFDDDVVKTDNGELSPEDFA